MGGNEKRRGPEARTTAELEPGATTWLQRYTGSGGAVGDPDLHGRWSAVGPGVVRDQPKLGWRFGWFSRIGGGVIKTGCLGMMDDGTRVLENEDATEKVGVVTG